MDNSFSARLSQALRLRHATQKELADKLHVTPTAVSGFIKGRYAPSPRTIRDICAALHISEEWLRTGDGDMDAPTDDLQAFIEQYHPDEIELRMFETFARLSDESKRGVLDLLRQLGHALDQDAEAEAAAPAAPLKPKGDPVPPPAGPSILDEYDDIEFDYLDTAAAHDVDGVSRFHTSEDDNDFNPA